MKPIKFDLTLNGARVRNLEELQDNFTVEILELHAKGILLKWLKSRNHLELAGRLEAIVPGPEADTLRQLCEVFDIEADGQVIAAILAQPAATADAPLGQASDAQGYKEKYEELARWLEDLKRNKLYVSQDEYNRFVKSTLDIECGAETTCVMFDDALFDKIEPRGRFYTVGMVSFATGAEKPYEERGLSFRHFKQRGDVVELGQAIGEFYSSGHASIPGGGSVKLTSPVRGILERFADSGDDPSHMVFRFGQPICYIREDHETDPTLKVVCS